MGDFEIIKGFRNSNDIDRLKVDVDTISSWTDCISFLKSNNLKGLVLYSSSNVRHTMDFSFLREVPFLDYFECIVSLTKKSDITGLYTLSNLKNFRWIVDNDLELDFSNLTTLKILITSDYNGLKNWSNLVNLEKLHISRLKRDDCAFLSNLRQLKTLKLTRANITSLSGLESCHNLEILELHHCTKITELTSFLKNCPGILSVSIIKCKNIQLDEINNIKALGKSIWFE